MNLANYLLTFKRACQLGTVTLERKLSLGQRIGGWLWRKAEERHALFATIASTYAVGSVQSCDICDRCF
jgi:hypothetical protein